MNMKKKKEKCVVCGRETMYNLEQHIDTRLDYVEGVGQLCTKCFNKTYGISVNKTEKDDIYRNNNFSLN